jgi:Asp-tRNA(Asn)/Glu-tRNA(Gln) amidotransferase A subunit family amidase
MLAGVRFEGPFNITGQPAIAVPAGKTAEGLPVGVQLAGRPFAESTLLRVAEIVERALASSLPDRSHNPLVV